MRKLSREKGGDIYLTEKQWRGMLERFNIDNIQKGKEYDFGIKVPCSLCVEFHKGEVGCSGCFLAKAGCLILVREYGSFELSNSATDEGIVWDKKDNRAVRAGIRKLRKVLLSLPRARRVK